MARTQNWALLLYPDDKSHYDCLQKLMDGNYLFAGILHDKDVYEADDEKLGHKKGALKKPHYHIVLSYDYQKTDTAVAKELRIDGRFIKPIGKMDDAAFPDKKTALGYLVHADRPHQYQYEVGEVFGKLASAVPVACDDSTSENELCRRLVTLIDSLPQPCTYKMLILAACDAELYSVLRRMGYFAGKLLDEHNNNGRYFNPNDEGS